jgi:hypothetical protein
MKDLSYLPHDYERLKIVSSMNDFLSYKFNKSSGVNIVVFPRDISHLPFDALAKKIAHNSDKEHERMSLQNCGRMARILKLNEIEANTLDFVSNDFEQIHTNAEYICRLDFERASFGKDNNATIPHFDVRARANSEETIICTYDGEATVGYKNEAISHINRNQFECINPDGIITFQTGDLIKFERVFIDQISGTERDIHQTCFVHNRPETAHVDIKGFKLPRLWGKNRLLLMNL